MATLYPEASGADDAPMTPAAIEEEERRADAAMQVKERAEDHRVAEDKRRRDERAHLS